MVVDGLMKGAQLLFESLARRAKTQRHRQHVGKLLVLCVGQGDILADRPYGGIEDLVFDMFVNFEFGRKQAHHVAALGVLWVHRFDGFEQPAQQLMMFEQHLVSFSGSGWKVGYSLGFGSSGCINLFGRQGLVAGLGNTLDFDLAIPDPRVVTGLGRN